MAISKFSSIFFSLMVLLPLVTFPATASQLNLYKGLGCSGSFTACFDRACCVVPSDAVSYKFYYNPSWKAYFYAAAGCTGSLSNVLSGDVVCVNGVNFKSAFLTDNNSIEMVTEEKL